MDEDSEADREAAVGLPLPEVAGLLGDLFLLSLTEADIVLFRFVD